MPRLYAAALITVIVTWLTSMNQQLFTRKCFVCFPQMSFLIANFDEVVTLSKLKIFEIRLIHRIHLCTLKDGIFILLDDVKFFTRYILFTLVKLIHSRYWIFL